MKLHPIVAHPRALSLALATFACLAGCSDSTDAPANGSGGGSGGSGQVGAGSAGVPGSSGAATSGGSVGASGSAGSGPGAGGTPSAGGAAPALTCSQAAQPFTVSSTTLDSSLLPATPARSFGSSLFARLPIAIDPASGTAYVGFTREDGDSVAGVIAAESGTVDQAISIPGAALGGVVALPGGFGVLAFDPNQDVDARTWAAVKRLDAQGQETLSTDLFHSPNLDDVGTKGAPSTSRLGYVAGSDLLVPYFAHTQRYDDGVRHQGGYLATVDAAGTQELMSGWFGSHNLDQRLLVSGDSVALLGLGDAYPKGIFFSLLEEDPNSNVIYLLAGNGSGTTNGQLGGIVDLGSELVVPFITNRSISQELSPGDWPDIDPAISDQIEAAASAGNELGLLHVPKSGSLPDGDLAPTWVDVSLAAGARLESLKSARYGSGGLILLAWAEVAGESRDETRSYFTMVVDTQGAICQPKTALGADQSFTAGDDFAQRENGSVVWANDDAGVVTIVTLTPG